MTKAIHVGPGPQAAPSIAERASALARVLRASDAIAFSIVFLPHFGIVTVPSFSISFALLAIYWLAIEVWRFEKHLSPARIGAMAIFAGVVAISGAAGDPNLVSPLSGLLLLTLFAPTIVTASLTPAEMQQVSTHVQNKFVKYCSILAAFAVAQFFLQFVISHNYIMDISQYVPSYLKATGIWNTDIPIRSFSKANGFFQLEPSGLSGIEAFGLLLEIGGQRRIKIILLLMAAMLVSYSGTGIVVFLSGILFTGAFRDKRIIFAAIGLAAIIFIFGDALGVDIITARTSEFSSPGSSGYARYVAPFLTLTKYIDLGMLNIWTGNGPGTYAPTIEMFKLQAGGIATGGIHDPTWAKLLFEYGAIGAVAIMAIIIRLTRSPGMPAAMRPALMVALLVTGGEIMQPAFVGLLYIFLFPWQIAATPANASRRNGLPRPRIMDEILS